MSDQRRTEPSEAERRRTEAQVRRGWWPGWIWAIPIAALLVVGWLGLRYLASGGEDITITFANAHGIKATNTQVVYRGVKVGTVSQVALNPKGTGVVVTASIEGGADKYLKTGTLFWLKGANPSLSNLSSLGAVLSGPTIVMIPGPGKAIDHFKGMAHKPALAHPSGRPLLYIASFTGAVGSLKDGDPVTLRGFTVGDIRQIGFHYNAKTGALSTPVTLALYPSAFHIQGAAQPDSRAALRAAINRLVQEGLRVRLAQSPPLIGSWQVSLAIIPGASAPTTTAMMDGLPELPHAPAGGLSSVLNKFKNVPIAQIAQNVLDITHKVDGLVSSPALSDSIKQLDAALKQIHTTTAKAGPQITKLVQQLRQTANKIDQTAGQAQHLMGGVTVQGGLTSTLREFRQAARSIRELANYLDRHPEAIIKGRNGG